MGNPLYRVRNSGYSGSGYARPPTKNEKYKTIKNADSQPIKAATNTDEEVIVVPGVTTITSMGGDPAGLIQWSVNQTAAYAVANIDNLLSRNEDQGYGFLRWYHKRTPDLTDPLLNAHTGVLNDLAELGTNVHEYIEWDLKGQQGFPPTVTSVQMGEMVDQYHRWKSEHVVEPLMVEETVYGDGYAGTLDLVARIDGKLCLLDVKTSRNVGDAHRWQIAALAMANKYYTLTDTVECEYSTENSKESFREVVSESATHQDLEDWHYGFLHLRPEDIDNKGTIIDAFCRLEMEPNENIDIHYKSFLACLTLRHNQRIIKDRNKTL